MKNAISTYKGGSSVILPNPHDEDYFCYYETEQERKHALITNHDRDKDFHFKLKSHAKTVFIGCYAIPYMELIEGEDLGLSDFNVHDYEKEYAEKLLGHIELFRNRGLENKRWYHIYLGYCALKNSRDKKFSQTQINKAQKIHDNGISEKDLQVIFDYLTNLVNN